MKFGVTPRHCSRLRLAWWSCAVQADTVKCSVESTWQAGKDFYVNAKKDFEAKNPGTTIQLELRRSAVQVETADAVAVERPPDVFDRIPRASSRSRPRRDLKDISPDASPAGRTPPPGGMSALSLQGQVLRRADVRGGCRAWYNKKPLAQAKVDPAAIQTVDGLSARPPRSSRPGITPIVAGGKDKWPLAFYYGYLAMRDRRYGRHRQRRRGQRGG